LSHAARSDPETFSDSAAYSNFDMQSTSEAPGRHPAAVAILLAALVLGVAGDLLLRWIPWGLNALLWTLLFCVAARICAVEGRSVPWIPLLGSLVAAAGMAWRDSRVLAMLDGGLLLLLLPMLALHARGVALHAVGIGELAVANVFTGAQSIAGAPQLVLTDLTWSRMPHVGFRGVGVAVRGVLIAFPALLIFGWLLVSADDTFARVLADLVAFDLGELARHFFVTAFIAAACAGFLRSLVLSGPMRRLPSAAPLTLPMAETNVALALVNVLFALFVIVQFRYFFGAAPDQLSQYARRGFFELVSVVALVLPMLLLLDWVIAKEHGAKLFRGLAAVQVLLVFIIAVSAYHRMQLYRDEFGLTQLRFYTTAFMIWLAVLLFWFVCTVLTGRRQRFAIGVIVTAIAAVLTLHAINPDRVIVETNVERSRANERLFDRTYHGRLSDDAFPSIVRHRDVGGEELVRQFERRPRPRGWRTWNYARSMAARYESKATPPIGRP